MDPNDFRIRTDLYFPYTEAERARRAPPPKPKPIAKCTNLIVERGPGYIGLKWDK